MKKEKEEEGERGKKNEGKIEKIKIKKDVGKLNVGI